MTPDSIIVPAELLSAPLDFPSLFGRADGPRPVEVEIGSGKGKFLVAAARRWPGHDFVGLELIAALVRKIRDKAQRDGLDNVRLVRLPAREVFEHLIPPASLARVHVYFPDPWPKRRHAKNRLFAGDFPALVARALAPRGELLLATDHDPYFREVSGILACHPDFVRTLPDPFREIPRGGFDAIFEAAGVPAFRGVWERVDDGALGRPGVP